VLELRQALPHPLERGRELPDLVLARVLDGLAEVAAGDPVGGPLEALWGGSDYRDPRTIDVHVRHLREKLERDPAEPEYILTVRGVGYRFRDR